MTRAEFDRLLAACREQQELLQHQQRQLEQQQRLLERLDGAVSPDISAPAVVDQAEAGEALVDRRSMLRRAGVAAGAVVGGVAGAALSASPAAAANGGNFILGQDNAASSTTYLTSSAVSRRFVVRSGSPAVEPSGVIVGVATAAGNFAIAGRSEGGSGVGIVGTGSGDGGTGGSFSCSTTGRQLDLNPAGPAGPARSGTYGPGEFVVSSDGDLWFCVGFGYTGGPAPEWRRISGPNAAGSLTVLPAPKRVFDSRAGQVPLNVAKGTFVNQTKPVDAKNNSSGVPADATAVLVNFAVTNTNSGGFGALWAFGVADPGTANINWGSANTTISNTVVTAVGTNAQFNCKIAGSADVIIDVIGYYR